MSQPIYECVRCGRKATQDEWERGSPKLEDWERFEREKRAIGAPEKRFKCPYCSYRVGKKLRPPIARRVDAI